MLRARLFETQKSNTPVPASSKGDVDTVINDKRDAMRAARNSILANLALAAIKLFAGLFGRSAAMLSDAVHSLSDVVSNVIVIVGIALSGKTSDKSHPYGHERFECVAALILSAVLLATGLGIGYSGVRALLSGAYEGRDTPGLIALIVALISFAVKEGMYWYSRTVAKRTCSGALMADAWHHRSDAFASAGGFVGILGARLGAMALDSLASVVICIFILKAAFDVFRDSIGKMTDRACDDAMLEEIHTTILAQRDVIGVDNLKTRLFGERIYVDVEIRTNGNATLSEAHVVAQGVHNAIETKFLKVKHCMVYVNPSNADH